MSTQIWTGEMEVPLLLSRDSYSIYLGTPVSEMCNSSKLGELKRGNKKSTMRIWELPSGIIPALQLYAYMAFHAI